MRRERRELLVRFQLAAACATALVLSAGAAGAQQLWSVGDVFRPADGPEVVIEGARVGPGGGVPGMPGVARSAVSAEIEVTYDYLRLGMGYLKLPLPDGSVIEAENAVFEDRGGGNLMWTGEVPGAGYESVLFTVQDGHMVGWFGEPRGPKYVVYAGPDGRGSLSEEVGPTGDWCGVGEGPGRDLVREAAVAGDRPTVLASESSDNRLDILSLYTTGTEQYWRVIGGPAVGTQQLADYLNMAFRNGAIPATANVIPEHWDPELASHPSTQGAHYLDKRSSGLFWHDEFSDSPDVERLRSRYEPDLVHFIPDVGTVWAAGKSAQRFSLEEPLLLTGWSTPHHLDVFAHEVGHALGGDHEPAFYGDSLDEFRGIGLWPYRFGHTDMTSCAKREGRGNRLWCPATIMSYGWDASRDEDPRTWSSSEPFYSSVRHKPNGWTIGKAGTSEVERVFHETVPVAVRSGAAQDGVVQEPKEIHAHWIGRDTARVVWTQQPTGSQQRPGVYRAALAAVVLAEGPDDVYGLGGIEAAVPSPNITPVSGGDGSEIGVDIAGLRPGGHYSIIVRGTFWYSTFDGSSFGGSTLRNLPSDVFLLEPPRAVGAPSPASQVGARVTGPNSVRLHWRDNSRVETGYEVWYRKWSGEEPDEVWSRYGEPLPPSRRHADIGALVAEEEVFAAVGYMAKRGRYSFVVVAYNDKGWSASETFDLEFLPGPHPEATPSGEITDCVVWRPTGIDLDGYRVHACLETPDGARRRAWDYELEADQSGLLYFFDRDNAEILVKVLDGCAINGHRWVFLAPVTTLPFRLQIREPGPYIANRRQVWHYDSKRRPQDRIRYERVGNPKDETARTVSDTTAFPCTTAEIAAAKAASTGAGSGAALLPTTPRLRSAGIDPARSLIAGAHTDCEPGGPTLTLRGGYTVSMCYETYEGNVGDARNWGLDSTQSGLMYFFERNNAEVLIKVLGGCGVNGHRWVFVAPVTDLAFNLIVESPDGQRWTHTNRLGRTAEAASDVSAFPCSSSA